MATVYRKPIGQLLVACYFAPILLACVFGCTPGEKGKMGFALSMAAVSLASLIMYLTLKRWEQEWRMQLRAVQKSQEAVKVAPQITAPSVVVNTNEEELKRKNEEIERLEERYKATQLEIKALQNEHEKAHFLLQTELHEKNELLLKTQNDLVERTLDVQMKEQTIMTIRTEVANLNFELRTLLKVANK